MIFLGSIHKQTPHIINGYNRSEYLTDCIRAGALRRRSRRSHYSRCVVVKDRKQKVITGETIPDMPSWHRPKPPKFLSFSGIYRLQTCHLAHFLSKAHTSSNPIREQNSLKLNKGTSGDRLVPVCFRFSNAASMAAAAARLVMAGKMAME